MGRRRKRRLRARRRRRRRPPRNGHDDRLPVADRAVVAPTEDFWERYGPGDDPEAGPTLALARHLAYGIGAGAVFGGAAGSALADVDAEARREALAVVVASVYGAALSLFGSRVLLGRLLSMDVDADESLVFHVSHLVYALTLGSWVGSRADGNA